MNELKPCPFCGGTSALRVLDQNEADLLGAEDENYSENPYYQVVCCMTENSPVPLADWQPGCGSAGGFRKTKEQAIATWNRRPEFIEDVPTFQAESNKFRTNADHIRNMTDEELEEFVKDCMSAGYQDGSITPVGADGWHMDVIDWLQQPAEEMP